MSEQNERPCNTQMLNDCPPTSVRFHDLDLGDTFTYLNPSDPHNPCIYVKATPFTHVALSSMSIPMRMTGVCFVRKVQITHITARYK